MSRPVALVVGGSRGLGLALARRLVATGHQVAISARDQSELDAASADLRRRGGTVHSYAADVSDLAAIEAMVSAVEADVGPIEAVFCVAGVIQVGPLDALRREHFAEAIDVMLWGPINVSTAVLPAMRRRRRGRIGIVTSVGGLIPAPHLLPYSTAKFGAVGFARGLRSELAGSGVTVTTIIPGLMRTGSHGRALFVGDHAREYAWFAAAASLPLLSMDADRAAETIRLRTLQGRSNVLLTPLTKVVARVVGLSPALTAGVLSVTTRLLPSARTDTAGALHPSEVDHQDEDHRGDQAVGPDGRQSATVEGRTAYRQLGSVGKTVLDRITVLGDRAARRFGQ